MLQVGDSVPDFTLTSDRGDQVSAAGLKGQRYVLYFYPKDDTPGCTTQACSFRDSMPRFDDLKVAVFGVSADSLAAHQKFVGKYQLNFPLLSDPDRNLLEAIGVWVEKSMYGRTYFGIQRATFVVDANGRIEKVWPKVKAKGHGEDVAAYLAGG